MKIGDTVYCIKNLISHDMGGSYDVAIKGNYYTIGNIDFDGDNLSVIAIENGLIYLIRSHFKLDDNFFDYHFITLKQLRKNKLEEIKNRNP